jgi:hypothetical protein
MGSKQRSLVFPRARETRAIFLYKEEKHVPKKARNGLRTISNDTLPHSTHHLGLLSTGMCTPSCSRAILNLELIGNVVNQLSNTTLLSPASKNTGISLLPNQPHHYDNHDVKPLPIKSPNSRPALCSPRLQGSVPMRLLPHMCPSRNTKPDLLHISALDGDMIHIVLHLQAGCTCVRMCWKAMVNLMVPMHSILYVALAEYTPECDPFQLKIPSLCTLMSASSYVYCS